MNFETFKSDLQRDEGFLSYAYKDSQGYLTIGVGRMVDKRLGGGITASEADHLLNNDIDRTWNDLVKTFPWIQAHPDPVQRALANMAFQMGVQKLTAFHRTLDFIKKGKYCAAADNAMKSLWARQTPARAKRVADLLRNATKGG